MEYFSRRSRERCSLKANFKKAPKLTTKVLHPGNCKQKVPTVLAIFHEITAAAVQSLFQIKKALLTS